MSEDENDSKYYVVNVIDVSSIIPFTKFKKVSEEAKKQENERVEIELNKFELILKKNYLHKKVIYIGKDKSDGKDIEYFLIEGNVKLTIILEPPATIIAEFIDKNLAELYVEALKKTFQEIIPENPIKEIFINEIKVEEGKLYHISIEKWQKTNKIWSQQILKWTTTVLILTVILTMILSFTNNILQAYISDWLKENSYLAQGFIGLLIGFLFQPINNNVGPWLENTKKGILRKNKTNYPT